MVLLEQRVVSELMNCKCVHTFSGKCQGHRSSSADVDYKRDVILHTLVMIHSLSVTFHRHPVLVPNNLPITEE